MIEASQLMKGLEQSKTINNFLTNCQYARDLGLSLFQAPLSTEHEAVLEQAMAGALDFIELVKEKIEEGNTPEDAVQKGPKMAQKAQGKQQK